VNIAIDQPIWLLLCLVGVASGVFGWRAMRGIPRFRRAIAVMLRVLLFAVLSVAMSGVYRVEKANDLAIIAVVDTSMSVESFASFGEDELGLPITIDRAARGFLAKASVGRLENDRLGIIAFDGRAQTIALPAKSQVLDRVIEISPIEGSDLVGAIESARMQLPPDANARIIVFSDGRGTTGGLSQLSVDVPIDVVPIRYAVEQEVVVQAVELPARASPGSIVDVRVVLRSLGRSSGEMLLSYNAEPVDLNGDQSGNTRLVEIEPGQSVLVFPVQLGLGRVHRFEARYIPTRIENDRYIGDTSLGNNQAGGVTLTSGKGRVLVVSETDSAGESQAMHLINTFERASWEIDAIVPSQFPADLLDLEAYDLVVLVNTPRDALEMEADALINAYVQDLGGGVVFVGGREALGAGGWQGSVIEDVLPVKLDVSDDLIIPAVAVVLVLDSSGSMRHKVMGSSRSQQAVANDAAAVVDVAGGIERDAVAGDERASAVEVDGVGLRQVDLGHQHRLARAIGQRHILADQPHHVGRKLRHLRVRQADAGRQTEGSGVLNAVVHQPLVLVEVIAEAGQIRTARQLRDLVPDQLLFIEAITETLLRHQRIQPELTEHVVAGDEPGVLREARISRNQVGRSWRGLVSVKAVGWQREVRDTALRGAKGLRRLAPATRRATGLRPRCAAALYATR